jgi:hypothetical protein
LKILLFVIFLSSNLLCHLAYSDELWVEQKNDTRVYFSLRKNQRGYVLKKYSQKKGEYQEKIFSKSYKDEESAKAYLSTNKSFKKVTTLEQWPVSVGESGLIRHDLVGDKKNQVIWEVKNEWNDEWEIRYAEWLQQNVGVDFYQKYNIPTDCADSVVGLRWIFSRINGLPAANTLADTNDLFGSFSMPTRWQNLNTAENWYDDELFKTAINYVMDLASTRTVVKDGYPVRIDRNGLLAGSYIITNVHNVGHAKIINETHYDEATELPFYTLASTVPRTVRLLVRETFVDQEWPIRNTKDILAFRWPVVKNSRWVLKPSAEHSRYSEEQYDENLKSRYPAFISFILSRVKNNYDPVKLIEFGVKEIVDYINLRVDIVNKGFEACSNKYCQDGTGEYDDWSTDSRDEKLLKKFVELDKLVKEFEQISPGLYANWVNQLRNTKVNLNGNDVTLSSVRYLFERKFTSPNPNVTPNQRWGLDAGKVIGSWLNRVEGLLNERTDLIAQNGTCSGDCQPGTDAWYRGNTFIIDSALNKLYVEVSSYCHVINATSCVNSFKSNNKKQLKFGTQRKGLTDWFDRIPYFNSDPRVSYARRWGDAEGKLIGFALPYFEKISISKTAIALLDEKKLINLRSGVTIFESTPDARLVLTEEGVVYQFMDSSGAMRKGNISGNSVSFYNLADPYGVLSDWSNRPISFSEKDGRPVFRKVTPDGIVVFRVRDDSVELINKHKGNGMQVGSLLAMVQDTSTISFADLEKNRIFEFNLPLSNTFKDMNKMKVLSYSYPTVLTEYLDPEWGLHYLLKVNVEELTWTVLDLGMDAPFNVGFASARLGKILLTFNPNEETPELYAVDILSNTPVITKLLNNLVGVTEFNDHVYFIQSQGSQWDQNLNNKLMDWTNSIQSFQLDSAGRFGNPIFLNSLGAYFSGSNAGTFVTFDENRTIKMPKSLLSSNDFQNIQLGVPQILSYRFNTSYGDYWSMGSAVNLGNTQKNLDEELSPLISLYAWINRGDLINERWQETFMSSSVKAGTLISIGTNMGMWWGATE